ncbi:sensor histidine kinase [Saccharothrix coeruleofusca]|uniref:histidine kinase n=1 Tax=Saccharothrix coeruleofusca TaxID=33919 RepID=A0A918EGY0_9PSEU|nr:HAMP domain-containing sensor histidine kinase [Saccharothrix coeruleofusca]GGP75075.1 two-component sensor histidine kinase [Saccharothrix coeruleofusca]
MSGSWAQAERAAVRRAGVKVGALTGLVITAVVALVGCIAYGVLVHRQDDRVWRELRYNAERGDPAAPPPCTWLFTLDDAPARGPAGFPLREDLEAVRASRSAVERTVERDGTSYAVRTQPRGGGAVQAVADLRYQLADRRFLLAALAVGELVGLLAAVVTGVVVGRRAVAPLAEALAKQRRFITDASHELRTPVARAYTRVQVLSRRAVAAALPVEHLAGLDRLAGSIRRFGEIIDDLLLSARLTADPADADRGPVDLAEVAESAVAAEAERAAERQLTLTVDRPDGPLLVRGVDSALRRAVGELLANAVGHTPPGGRVALSMGRAGGVVALTVADTGDGFDPAWADRLFDRFHRGPGAGERRYGLGLALLREVVTSHGGTVEAVGHPGRGAEFTIRLPGVAQVPAPRGGKPASRAPGHRESRVRAP